MTNGTNNILTYKNKKILFMVTSTILHKTIFVKNNTSIT